MSQIQKFYAGENIFITGGTGFLGKVLTEKLLRSCPDLGSIYLLVRAKKGKSVQERIVALINDPVFDVLRNDFPDFSKKIVGVAGDITVEKLGLTTADYARIVNEVSVIFHLAATVRFNEKLETAVPINVNSVKYIVDIAKACKNLRAGIYVSTAYSHCVRKSINEQLYPPPLSYEQAKRLIEDVTKEKWSEDLMESFTTEVLGEWPNTYSYTKAVAEGVVAEFAKDIPFAVFRPSIVLSTYTEPVPGWLSGVMGFPGMMCVLALGIAHAHIMNKDVRCDVVPVDYVCNALISCAWKTALTKRQHDEEIPVYNYVSGSINPITWRKLYDKIEVFVRIFPTNAAIYYPFGISTNSVRVYSILEFFLHVIPAILIDSIAKLFGKQPGIHKTVLKIGSATRSLAYFTTRQWNFESERVPNLWNQMEPMDRRTFPFDIRNLDWDEYSMKIFRGCRKYVLGDSDGNEEQARRRYTYLHLIHTIVRLIFGICIFWIIWKIFY